MYCCSRSLKNVATGKHTYPSGLSLQKPGPAFPGRDAERNDITWREKFW